VFDSDEVILPNTSMWREGDDDGITGLIVEGCKANDLITHTPASKLQNMRKVGWAVVGEKLNAYHEYTGWRPTSTRRVETLRFFRGQGISSKTNLNFEPGVVTNPGGGATMTAIDCDANARVATANPASFIVPREGADVF
jgi:hypothetical protein